MPSAWRRMIFFVVAVPYFVKAHPTMISPLFWIARLLTEPLNHHQIVKESSIVPPVLRRMIPFAVTQLYAVKFPQAMIFPSFWTARALTEPLNQAPMVNHVSRVPSVLRRMILVIAVQL